MKPTKRGKFLRLAVGVAILAIAGVVGGCKSVQVSQGVYGEFKMGELQVFADQDFMTVHKASVAALKDVKLFQTKDDRKVIEAELNARGPADELVIVKIKEVGTKRTSIKIRYGLGGDLAQSQALYAVIAKNM